MPRALESWIFAVLCILLGSSALLAQSRKPEDLQTGKLLVAPHDSGDPNFAESVVLLVHYGEDGAVGLMVNQKTTVSVSKALPDLKGSNAHSEPVYLGGPVELRSVLGLLASSQEPEEATHVLGNISLISTKSDLESALSGADASRNLRIFVGYCGWAPGQLENEIKSGGWYIFDGSQELVFDSNPATLWSRLISKTELHVMRLPGRLLSRSDAR